MVIKRSALQWINLTETLFSPGNKNPMHNRILTLSGGFAVKLSKGARMTRQRMIKGNKNPGTCRDIKRDLFVNCHFKTM